MCDRKMDSLLKQTGSVYLYRAAVGGGLTHERGLNLGCDVNGDCHGRPPKSYGTAASVWNQANTATAIAGAFLSASIGWTTVLAAWRLRSVIGKSLQP